MRIAIILNNIVLKYTLVTPLKNKFYISSIVDPYIKEGMSTKKKVDSRVRTLIENGVKSQHRSLFVIVGDHGKDQACHEAQSNDGLR